MTFFFKFSSKKRLPNFLRSHRCRWFRLVLSKSETKYSRSWFLRCQRSSGINQWDHGEKFYAKKNFLEGFESILKNKSEWEQDVILWRFVKQNLALSSMSVLGKIWFIWLWNHTTPYNGNSILKRLSAPGWQTRRVWGSTTRKCGLWNKRLFASKVLVVFSLLTKLRLRSNIDIIRFIYKNQGLKKTQEKLGTEYSEG